MISNVITLSLNQAFHEAMTSRLEEVMGKAYYLTSTNSFQQFVDTFHSMKYAKPVVIVENCSELNDMLHIFYPEILKADCPFLNPSALTPPEAVTEGLLAIVDKNDYFSGGFQTSIKGMALLNLIYIYVLIGENRHLRVTEAGTGLVGFMKIGKNKITAAKTADSHGLIALIDMLQWQSGSVDDESREIEYEPIDALLIDGPQALMHAAQAIDEGNTQPASMP